MALEDRSLYFAKLDENNIVINVIVIDDEELIKKASWDPLGLLTGKKESEAVGISYCKKLFKDPNSKWVQTSYNGNMRGNYASVGYTYLTGVRTLGVASTDVFIEQQPHPSWSVGINTVQWEAPIPKPQLTEFEKNSKMMYRWNEDNYKNNPSRAWVIGSQ